MRREDILVSTILVLMVLGPSYGCSAEEEETAEAQEYFESAWRDDSCESAVVKLEKAIALDDSRPEFYQRRAYCHIQMGEHRDAVRYLDRAISMDDQFVSAYVDRAIARRELNNFEGAIADLSVAMKLHAEGWTFANTRGELYAKTSQCRKAIEDFKHFIDGKKQEMARMGLAGNAPEVTSARLQLARCYLDINQRQEAVKHLGCVIKENGKMADSREIAEQFPFSEHEIETMAPRVDCE